MQSKFFNRRNRTFLEIVGGVLAALVFLAACASASPIQSPGEPEALPQPNIRMVAPPFSVRIKDITEIEGVRGNTITGLGLVVGLAGTGGQNPATREALLNVFENLGLRSTPQFRAAIANNQQVSTANISFVYVTAELPPFAYRGQKLDVTVSIADDATSLENGRLVLTYLRGVDEKEYALAGGSISLSGFGASGQAASVQKNALSSGRIPDGAVVEETLECEKKIGSEGYLRLMLRNRDMKTANRVAQAINQRFRNVAVVEDSRSIYVNVPNTRSPNVISQFVAEIQELRVTPDNRAKVIINERNGTIVIGEAVRLSRVAIKHGSITISTVESPQVSQPAPLSDGQTVVVPRTDLNVDETQTPLNIVEPTTSLADLVNALNSLGVTPRELSSILQELKRAGSLHGELTLDR